MDQLADGFVNIGVSEVSSALDEAVHHVRRPASCQFLERAYIQVAVMKEALQLRHVAIEKPPVLTNAVAANRRGAGRHQGLEKFQSARFRLHGTHLAGAYSRHEARGAMLLLIPLVHQRERALGL